MKKNRTNIFIFILLLIGAAASMVPLFWLVRSSFMSLMEIYEMPPLLWSREPTFDNFQTVFFADVPFFSYLLNTIRIILPVLIGTILASSISAYGFSRFRFPFRSAWFAVCIGTMLLPGVVTMIPNFLIWQQLGLVNTYVPLTLPVWFGGGAFNIFLFRQFFMTLPKELDESARIDGAGYLRIYLSILMPLLKPVIIVVGLFTFINTWNDFFGPLLFLYDMEKYTLALGLQLFTSAYGSDYGAVMAAAAVTTVPIIVIFFIGQKYFVEGIVMTGIKA